MIVVKKNLKLCLAKLVLHMLKTALNLMGKGFYQHLNLFGFHKSIHI